MTSDQIDSISNVYQCWSQLNKGWIFVLEDVDRFACGHFSPADLEQIAYYLTHTASASELDLIKQMALTDYFKAIRRASWRRNSL
jgi:hypothetical protein